MNNLRVSDRYGFSLIELMVVIAIVAVLAAVAVPSYKDYMTRSRFAALMPLLDSYKTHIVELYNTTGAMPLDVDLEPTAQNNFLVSPANNIRDDLAAYYGLTSIYYQPDDPQTGDFTLQVGLNTSWDVGGDPQFRSLVYRGLGDNNSFTFVCGCSQTGPMDFDKLPPNCGQILHTN
jgi:prepilin-type N-terminal cleavage/methylation domain-containing protein